MKHSNIMKQLILKLHLVSNLFSLLPFLVGMTRGVGGVSSCCFIADDAAISSNADNPCDISSLLPGV